MKKTFGDKVHQFLRRIGIKETQTVDVEGLLKEISDLAKEKGQGFHQLQITMSRHKETESYKHEFYGYINPSKSSGTQKTPKLLMEKLRESYNVAPEIVNTIIL